MNKALIEALLFVAGEEGLSLTELSGLLDVSTQESYAQMVELQKKYNSSDSGITLIEVGEKYKLATKKEFSESIKKYASSSIAGNLSQPALETLAIIAYKQPLTRLDVEEIRGVQSSGAIQTLKLRGLIEESGRINAPGRPFLYRTTHYFMNYFGLKNLADLPDIEELEKTREDENESDLFFERFKEKVSDLTE